MRKNNCKIKIDNEIDFNVDGDLFKVTMTFEQRNL